MKKLGCYFQPGEIKIKPCNKRVVKLTALTIGPRPESGSKRPLADMDTNLTHSDPTDKLISFLDVSKSLGEKHD